LPWLRDKVEVSLRRIAQAAKERLMALPVRVGLAMLRAAMESEVAERVGPKSRHQKDRQACRHGYEVGWVVIGGRKVHVEGPRLRRKVSGGIRLGSYEWAQ
jgi:hypothetical protein